MRFIIGLVLIAHGLAHSVGIVTPWRIGPGKNAPYNTTVLNGVVDLGEIGIRAMGILWLVAGLAFVVAGIGVMAGASWGGIATLDAAMFSLILGDIGWPTRAWVSSSTWPSLRTSDWLDGCAKFPHPSLVRARVV